jgi:hypothetical protein
MCPVANTFSSRFCESVFNILHDFLFIFKMKAGTFILSFAIAIQATAMTPPGLIPSNTEDMTAFFNTSTLATNGAPITQADM